MDQKVKNLQEIIKMQSENVQRLSSEIQACRDQLDGLMQALKSAEVRRDKYQDQLLDLLSSDPKIQEYKKDLKKLADVLEGE